MHNTVLATKYVRKVLSHHFYNKWAEIEAAQCLQ